MDTWEGPEGVCLIEVSLYMIHVGTYMERRVACVAWRFWLGELSNKGGRGQRNREELGAGATWFLFFSRLRRSFSRASHANFSWLRRSCARLDKTAMLRRLREEVIPTSSCMPGLVERGYMVGVTLTSIASH